MSGDCLGKSLQTKVEIAVNIDVFGGDGGARDGAVNKGGGFGHLVVERQQIDVAVN